jgi:hypothetical protein
MPPRTVSALPSVPSMWPARTAQARRERYAAQQAYEPGQRGRGRLARRVRDLAARLDDMAE